MAIVGRNPITIGEDRSGVLDTLSETPRTGHRGARRYLDTLQRRWFLAVLPVLILPVASFFVAHAFKGNATITANIWVSQDSTKHLPYSDPLSNPATNVTSALQQLLQTMSFDLRVAKESPLYWASMQREKNRDIAIVADISKKLVPTAAGPDLVSINYTNKSGPAGLQLMQNVLKDAPQEIGKLNQRQSASTLAFYEHQRKSAQQRLDRATAALGHYAKQHHISPAQMADRALFDPTFSALYQTAQSAQVAVHDAEQQLTDVTGPNSLGSSIQIIDAPGIQPAQVSKKQLALDLGIGIIVGLLLGMVYVVVMTAADRSLRYSEEVSQLVGLPVLVSTPYVAELEKTDRKRRRSRQ